MGLRSLSSLGSLGSRSSITLTQSESTQSQSSDGQPPYRSPSFSKSNSLVRSDSLSSQSAREGLTSGGRDFLSSVSSELNGLAAQTTSMFSGLFGTIIGSPYHSPLFLDVVLSTGSKNSNKSTPSTPQPFRLHLQDGQKPKERQPPFGPFPRRKKSCKSILARLNLLFGSRQKRIG